MTRQAKSIRQAGVTLMELIIVMAIVGVLAVAALPSIVDRWQRETVILIAERIASAVSLAQATATHRHVWTYLGPRDRSLGWGGGWELVMSPKEHTLGTHAASPDKVVLYGSLPTRPSVTVSSNLTDDALSYSPVGYLQPVTGGSLTVTSGRHQRRVRINSAGRTRICNPGTDGDRCKITGDDAPDS